MLRKYAKVGVGVCCGVGLLGWGWGWLVAPIAVLSFVMTIYQSHNHDPNDTPTGDAQARAELGQDAAHQRHQPPQHLPLGAFFAPRALYSLDFASPPSIDRSCVEESILTVPSPLSHLPT